MFARKFILITVLIGLLFGSLLLFHKMYSLKLSSSSITQISASPTITPSPTPLDMSLSAKLKRSEPISIALLGYGGSGHDGGMLTDTLIVAQYKPKDHQVLLLTIPRDLWVQMPLSSQSAVPRKINSAFAYGFDEVGYTSRDEYYKGKNGPFHLLQYALKEVTGLTIDGFVGLDFKSFESIIDQLGGVEVNVERAFIDEEYPIAGKETDLCGKSESDLPQLMLIATVSASQAFPCRYEKLEFEAGNQRMDGKTALKFVRSRHAKEDGSDFNRSQRQKKIIVAIRDTLLQPTSLTKLPSIAKTLFTYMLTNLDPSILSELLPYAARGIPDIQSIALSDTNYLMFSVSEDNQSILVPKDPMTSWQDIHDRIQLQLGMISSLDKPIVELEYPTVLEGNVASIAATLESRNFLVRKLKVSRKALENPKLSVTNKLDKQRMQDLFRSIIPTIDLLDNSFDLFKYPYEVRLQI